MGWGKRRIKEEKEGIRLIEERMNVGSKKSYTNFKGVLSSNGHFLFTVGFVDFNQVIIGTSLLLPMFERVMLV